MLDISIRFHSEGNTLYREMVVLHNYQEIGRFDDQMEPEDANFSRDLSWIEPLLRKVYSLGVSDGIASGELKCIL